MKDLKGLNKDALLTSNSEPPEVFHDTSGLFFVWFILSKKNDNLREIK